MAVTPVADSTYLLTAEWGSRRATLRTLTIRVELPPDITIDDDYLAPLLCQALKQEDTTIRILNSVELDLSACPTVSIAKGVTLVGGRTPRQPGALLYSRARKTLFLIRRNDVRITGLRIQGPDPTDIVNGGDRSVAIYVSPGQNVAIDHVEIDHNEIYGWKNEAIGVNDENHRISYGYNPWAVRIHDNYIHHNQEQDSAGYGVVVGSGAYALIERNVFDYNRHGISGDGSDYSGYLASHNLVLQHGGRHDPWYGGLRHTHQFDMHGQSCGSLCGTAEHYIYIHHNSFLYTAAAALKIRGAPQEGAYVESNVFAHDFEGEAVQQTWPRRRLYTANNRYGIDGSDQYGYCDFDGDGTTDRFMATGQTWWYASGGTGPWVYLNTSQRLLSELTLGQFDGDDRCDVVTGDLISSGGTARWTPVDGVPSERT